MDDSALRVLFESATDAIIVLDADARVSFCNASAATLLDVSAQDLNGHPIASVLPSFRLPEDEAAGRHQVLVHRGSDRRRLDVSVSQVGAAGRSRRTLLIARAAARQPEGSRAAPAARFDDVIPLPGRSLFSGMVRQAVGAAVRRRSSAAVLLLDIDRFMEVNHALGHSRGDDVLRAVAERVRGVLRTSDALARFSENQFAVLVPSRATPSGAAALVDRIQASLLRPFQFDGVTLYVTMTVGVALTSDGEGADELLRNADVALHQAKQAGPLSVATFTPKMGLAIDDSRQLESDLRLALQRDELEVFYQPQIRIADGALLGFEALIRWRQPGRGLRPPLAFLDVAATSGLIVPMGRFVLGEACRQVRRWRSRPHPGQQLSVSVNLSVTEILQPDLVDAVRDALGQSGLAPEALELEITESALLEASQQTKGVLFSLKDLGVGLAIDDFGVGYSYLSHLRDFPIDRVKVDRSFIAGLGVASEDRTIVEAVVRLAHELGLSVVAEGVETKAQAALLATMHCDVAQGYHFAPPLSARAAAQFGLPASGPAAVTSRRAPSRKRQDRVARAPKRAAARR